MDYAKEWLVDDLVPRIEVFCKRLSDELGIHIEGTTLVEEASGPNFKTHAPLNFVYNDTDLEDLIEIMCKSEASWKTCIEQVCGNSTGMHTVGSVIGMKTTNN